ncbi:MAG: DUF3489 domain-containing protein [Acidobacteriota bacterium]
MKSFNIDRENNITAFAKSKDAEGASGDTFRSEAELSKLAAGWPAARLAEIWNSIPGFVPVKKFTNRKTAVVRIWKAIQSLGGGVGAQAANVAADETVAGTVSTPAQNGTRSKHVAKDRKAARKPPTTAAVARPGSKTADMLAMLRHPKGATLQQLMQATGWQAHSVRGFISGTLGKKMDLTVASLKGEDGERHYSVIA